MIGDWSPSIEAIQAHLVGSHGIDPTGLSLEQMLTVHDNDHNRMGHRPGHGSHDGPKGSTRSYRKF